MKPWKDLTTVPMPSGIKTLPRDERGYPIPYGVQWNNGVPDFRVIDPDKWMEAVQNRRCGLCGGKMGKSVAFVGGKLSIKNRLFTDSPMHAECAIYALQVCPFLAMRKFGYVTHHNEDEVHVNQLVSNNRPEVFGMGIAEKYKIVPISPTDIAIKAGIFKSLTLWRHGEQVRSWNIAAPQ